jgi:hypothetical protein
MYFAGGGLLMEFTLPNWHMRFSSGDPFAHTTPQAFGKLRRKGNINSSLGC